MKRLRIIRTVLIFAMIMLLSGCGFIDGVSTRVNKIGTEVMTNWARPNLKMTKEVLKCFNEKDAKALKALLCAKTQGLSDIDKQILASFDLFKGKITSFNEHVLGYEGESIDKGRKVLSERSWNVEDIVTDAGGAYEIYINEYIICKKDKNREGISQITITSRDGKELTIGYKWPIYFNEGRDMSYDIIEAFSNNNIDGLKSKFCAKTLKTVDIDAQIKEALDFFEGKATMGKVQGTDLKYDGNHSCNILVSDDEIVKKNNPIRTSINVFIENIETDAKKIYKIEFYADLLNTDDETYKGISQMIIIGDDRRAKVIGGRLN